MATRDIKIGGLKQNRWNIINDKQAELSKLGNYSIEFS